MEPRTSCGYRGAWKRFLPLFDGHCPPLSIAGSMPPGYQTLSIAVGSSQSIRHIQRTGIEDLNTKDHTCGVGSREFHDATWPFLKARATSEGPSGTDQKRAPLKSREEGRYQIDMCMCICTHYIYVYVHRHLQTCAYTYMWLCAVRSGPPPFPPCLLGDTIGGAAGAQPCMDAIHMLVYV